MLGRPWKVGPGPPLRAVRGGGQPGTLSKLSPQFGVYGGWGAFPFLRLLQAEKLEDVYGGCCCSAFCVAGLGGSYSRGAKRESLTLLVLRTLSLFF